MVRDSDPESFDDRRSRTAGALEKTMAATKTAKKTTAKPAPKTPKKRPPLTLPAGLAERLDARATLQNIRWHRERARELREEARPGETAMVQVAEEHEAIIDLFNELRAARRRS